MIHSRNGERWNVWFQSAAALHLKVLYSFLSAIGKAALPSWENYSLSAARMKLICQAMAIVVGTDGWLRMILKKRESFAKGRINKMQLSMFAASGSMRKASQVHVGLWQKCYWPASPRGQ